jgi:hypothetical protein
LGIKIKSSIAMNIVDKMSKKSKKMAKKLRRFSLIWKGFDESFRILNRMVDVAMSS